MFLVESDAETEGVWNETGCEARLTPTQLIRRNRDAVGVQAFAAKSDRDESQESNA